MTTVLLVEKVGTIKPLKIKEYKEEEFYKKCGYKSANNFKKHHTWKSRINGTTYSIHLFAKSDVSHSIGENKYEFPPPVDSVLFYGTCLLAASVMADWDRTTEPVSLSVDLWNQIYNHLYGGFENLADTAEADAKEVDELEDIPAHKKTPEGYLKDGFVVDPKPRKVAGGGGAAKPKKATSHTNSNNNSKSNSNRLPIPITSLPTTNSATKSLADEEDILGEGDEDEEDSTVYTDLDEDEDDEASGVGGGGSSSSSRAGSKKKKSASKKKGTQKDSAAAAASMELTIQELLITDELKEEPYAL
jgi:hypothetical protein